MTMMPKILRGRPTNEPAALAPPLTAQIGPDVLTLTDREMSRQFEAAEATFFAENVEDIAHLAGSWWQYYHDKRLWVRVIDPGTAAMIDDRRPGFVVSEQNHAKRREIRRAARANPDTGERDES